MSPSRVEPFQMALRDLRERLREGILPPGARITAKEIAEALNLSPTPVREALSRLAGEGILEDRRGDGFFVRGLTASDIADLYRMSLALLATAQEADRKPHRDLTQPSGLQEGEDPVRAVERLFSAWVAESASRILMDEHRVLALRIAPVRRLEHHFIDDLRSEAEDLLALADSEGRPGRLAALEGFHDRRIALAERLAHRLDPEGGSQV